MERPPSMYASAQAVAKLKRPAVCRNVVQPGVVAWAQVAHIEGYGSG